MSVSAAWRKVLLFGACGAAGCLAGWLVGEPVLWAAGRAGPAAGAPPGPSLIARPAEPPALPAEFRERLERAGGKSGDVQISLIWFNANDLDLHCVDPSGERVFYKNRRARSGGELDVDANAGVRDPSGRGPALTREPVENVFWPRGGAPAGRYRVEVNHFAHRPEEGAPNETKFKVNVLHDGKRHEFAGEIAHRPGGDNFRTIYEFELGSRPGVAVPDEIALAAGRSVRVPVLVERRGRAGAVSLRAEKLPDGVTAARATIAAGSDAGELVLSADGGAGRFSGRVEIVAEVGGQSGSAEVALAVVPVAFSGWLVAVTGVWTALLAAGLCVALLAGQNRYVGKPAFAAGRGPLALVALGAGAAGFASGAVGQVLYFALLVLGIGKLGFVIGWVLLGALLGWGVSRFVPNLDAQKAALAGLGGGLLGAVAFAVLSSAADLLGRFGGAAALGFCIGLMVAAVEAAFRRAWLEVRFGAREAITVNLGPEPVKVGGDAKLCTVWARGAADVALRYWVRDGRVWCEDVPAKREAEVADGDTRAAGGVTVVVRTGTGTGAPAGAPPKPPVRAAAPKPPPVPVSANAPAPAAPVPQADDGLPVPMSPPAPARPAVASILDADTPARPAPKPVAPPVPKPPAPVARAGEPDACPGCGRKLPGRPGARYCMVCDRTF